MLTEFLDWHRRTLELKCSGLAPAQLSERALPPSRLSLQGIVRHLAGVERWWFQIRFAGEEVPLLFYSDEDPSQDFEDLSGPPAADLATWRAECDRARRIVAGSSLEDRGTLNDGRPVSLRHVLVSMIAEYSRHNGHADLLRERLDGAVGF